MVEENVRIGIVGLGSAGSLHARALTEGKVPSATLAAVVCSEARLRQTADASCLPPYVRRYDTLEELLAGRGCDAVIVATPHPVHPDQTIAALRAGFHVLCEKPAGIRAREAREMAAQASRFERIYSLNYNRRTAPLYRTIRDMVRRGQIGTIRRILWTSTSWLRGQAYYDSSVWRGSWAGEGGGLLLNQWPHLLDLWQWIFGMPMRLRASCSFGKHHAIEVEDEVCVFAEYASGATAVLIGSTGEAPGRERIEIVGDRGQILAEADRIHVTRLKSGTVDDFIAQAPAGFANPATCDSVLFADSQGDLVSGITKDFAAAVAAGDGRALLAPGSEGAASLMLANAILLSGWQDGVWVELPLGEESEIQFEGRLNERVRSSKPRCLATSSTTFALEESFRHV